MSARAELREAARIARHYGPRAVHGLAALATIAVVVASLGAANLLAGA